MYLKSYDGGSKGRIFCIMVEGVRDVFTALWWKE